MDLSLWQEDIIFSSCIKWGSHITLTEAFLLVCVLLKQKNLKFQWALLNQQQAVTSSTSYIPFWHHSQTKSFLPLQTSVGPGSLRISISKASTVQDLKSYTRAHRWIVRLKPFRLLELNLELSCCKTWVPTAAAATAGKSAWHQELLVMRWWHQDAAVPGSR